MKQNTKKIIAFATQGSEGLDELRLKILLENLTVQFLSVQKNNLSEKIKSAGHILKTCMNHKPDLVIMEGTGLLGGIPLIFARILFGTRYVVSSGDAVGPFFGLKSPLFRPIGAIYERVLYRLACGFIGWTPYLTGRALTFGTPQAITAAGFQKFIKTEEEKLQSRNQIRKELGISSDAIVVGIVGSLAWNQQVNYCYGLELVSAIKALVRKDVVALIVGDGEGKSILDKIAGSALNQNIFLTGRVKPELVPDYLSAMDLASLPQSVDAVGNFRYTTKISEYISARLPMIVAQNPFSYDLDRGSFWRLPGKTPWSKTYISAITNLLERISIKEIASKTPVDLPEFDQQLQVNRVHAFINDLIEP